MIDPQEFCCPLEKCGSPKSSVLNLRRQRYPHPRTAGVIVQKRYRECECGYRYQTIEIRLEDLECLAQAVTATAFVLRDVIMPSNGMEQKKHVAESAAVTAERNIGPSPQKPVQRTSQRSKKARK